MEGGRRDARGSTGNVGKSQRNSPKWSDEMSLGSLGYGCLVLTKETFLNGRGFGMGVIVLPRVFESLRAGKKLGQRGGWLKKARK